MSIGMEPQRWGIAFADGCRLPLSRRQAEVFGIIYHAERGIIAIEAVAKRLYNAADASELQAVRTHVSRLREHGLRRVVRTVIGFGYFVEAPAACPVCGKEAAA